MEPEHERQLGDALGFCWAGLAQVEQLGKSLTDEFQAMSEGGYKFRRTAAATSWYIEAVMIVANRLRKALADLPTEWNVAGLNERIERDVQLLRNVYEHAEDQGGWARRELEERHPGVDPSAISMGPDGLIIGPVPLQQLVSDFAFVESQLLAIESGEIAV